MHKYLQIHAGFELSRVLANTEAFIDKGNPWRETPNLELVIRTESNPRLIQLYSTWFLTSLKLFWPEHRLNLTLVLNDEDKQDYATGTRLAQMWPYPKVIYRKSEDPIYANVQRRRMLLSYFFPEEYVSAEYVGFVDTEIMFTTVVTPRMLFVDGRPTVQARSDQPYYQTYEECWSDVTEYFIGKREALQCTTYFPVIFKVQHIVGFRKFVENRFGKPFLEVFKKSFDFSNQTASGGDCFCQYSIICNYVWYYHRDEYDFHLQMAPNRSLTGEHRREHQQPLEYLKSIDPKYFIPKPRVAMHTRQLTTDADTLKDPVFTYLKHCLREGFCHSIWFDRCPENCQGIEKNSVQLSLYMFERTDWTWDKRCIVEQRKHYEEVKKMVAYNEKHDIKMFGVEKYLNACNETFEFKL